MNGAAGGAEGSGGPASDPGRGPGPSGGSGSGQVSPLGRVVALDYGRRRIGVAASDPTALIASPHTAVEKSGAPDRIPETLVEVLGRLEPRTVVVGIPLEMDGSTGPMAREAQKFARALAGRTGLSVVEWDERLSTARAEREIREMGVPKKKREAKGFSDMMAATIILQGYLASRSAP